MSEKIQDREATVMPQLDEDQLEDVPKTADEEMLPTIQQIENIEYEELYNFLRPLDLLVFKGKTFVEKWIIAFQKRQYKVGEWTHVGLVYPADDIPFKNRSLGNLYIWESVISGDISDGVPDCESGKGYFGIQVRDLKEVLRANQKSGSDVGILRLRNNPMRPQEEGESAEDFKARRDAVKEKIKMVHTQYHGLDFDINPFNCFGAVCPCCTAMPCATAGDAESSKKAFFCSEFATQVYVDLGLLPKDVDPQLVSPQELISMTGDLEGKSTLEEFWEDKIYVVNPVDIENIPRQAPIQMDPPGNGKDVE